MQHAARMRTLLIVAALAGPAHADTAARANLDVAAEGGTHEAQAAVGGSVEAESIVRYATITGGSSSSFAHGTASAMLRAGTDGPGLTFRQEAHARPYAFEAVQIELADRLALDVAPKLSDRPDRWRRRYTDAGFDFDVIGAQWLGAHVGVQFIRCANGFDVETQHDGGATARRAIETADWAPLSITRRRDGEETARLDPIVMEGHAIGGAHSGVVLTTFYPRITGIPLGIGHLDLAFGHAETGWTQTSVNGQVVSTITSAQLPALRVPAARARLTTALGRFAAAASVERGMYLSMDAALVVEERATATLATTIDGANVTASGFAAHSVIWTSKTASTEHVTGGGALALDLGLADRWRLAGQAELARTFYASLDGDRVPRVDTALRFDVGLHREIKNWVPR